MLNTGDEPPPPAWRVGQVLLCRAGGGLGRIRCKVVGVVGDEVWVTCSDHRYHDENRPTRCLTVRALSTCVLGEERAQ